MFCSIRQISPTENAFSNEADVNRNVNGFLESLAKLDSVSRKCHDGYGSESNSLLPAAASLSVVEEAGREGPGPCSGASRTARDLSTETFQSGNPGVETRSEFLNNGRLSGVISFGECFGHLRVITVPDA